MLTKTPHSGLFPAGVRGLLTFYLAVSHPGILRKSPSQICTLLSTGIPEGEDFS
ncbi:hypothetical protein J7E73_13755 [Paenibacillus albidus]|nr:hypothetical protein [Paenibacillus albidus]